MSVSRQHEPHRAAYLVVFALLYFAIAALLVIVWVFSSGWSA